MRPINPSDIFCIQGIYGGWHPKLPATPGLEGDHTMVLDFAASGQRE